MALDNRSVRLQRLLQILGGIILRGRFFHRFSRTSSFSDLRDQFGAVRIGRTET